MLLFSNILLFFCILALPVYFSFYPPKDINLLYGYRTKRSMKNKNSWNFANHYSAKLLLKLSIITVIFQVILHLLFGVMVSIIVTSFVWIIALFATLFITEKKLKEKE